MNRLDITVIDDASPVVELPEKSDEPDRDEVKENVSMEAVREIVREDVKKPELPLVSIIIPIFNVEKYLIKCVNSCIEQTYPSIEVILVDDCSTDRSGKMCDRFAELYKDKVKVIHNQENSGTYISINNGIVASSGSFITLLGGDDYYTKNKIMEQVVVMLRYLHLKACICKYKRLNDRGKAIITAYCESSIMFRREVIDKCGYYDSVKFSADTEMLSRITTLYGKKALGRINRVMYVAVSRKNSLTTSADTGMKSVARKVYKRGYERWHKVSMNLFVDFPMKTRPFPVHPLSIMSADNYKKVVQLNRSRVMKKI